MTSDTQPLADRFAAEIVSLDRELSEIEMLIAHARVEAGRHEQRRIGMADKAAAIDLGGSAQAAELVDLNGQLVVLAKRAALMEAQVEVLEGKRKALVRFRDAVAGYAGQAADATDTEPGATEPAGEAPANGAGDHASELPLELPLALSRVVLTAQEDLRREIARAMHDGPAQSLTNIVLQAQILERIMARDPEQAESEIHQLIGMVQQTLEATKTFIFDIRPMVLDDLGLVPTLRRATRERGRRTGVAVQFETVGADQRLSVDVESGLFRILDEGIAGYLSNGAERLALGLDWGDVLVARLVAGRGQSAGANPAPPAPAPEPDRRRGKKDRDAQADEELPPALAAMVRDRQDAATAVARAAIHIELPAGTWREIQQRATTIGATVEQLDDGSHVRLTLPLGDAPSPGG